MKLEVYYAEFGEVMEFVAEIPVCASEAEAELKLEMKNPPCRLPWMKLDEMGDVDRLALCEDAYRLCNSYAYPWFENDDVAVSNFVKKQGGARSMCVGDFVRIVDGAEDRWFIVKDAGFEELNDYDEDGEAVLIRASRAVCAFVEDEMMFKFPNFRVPFKLMKMLAKFNRAK